MKRIEFVFDLRLFEHSSEIAESFNLVEFEVTEVAQPPTLQVILLIEKQGPALTSFSRM
jgi:hypothetical protein